MRLRDFCVRGLGGVALLGVGACSSEDGTILWDTEANQPGAGGSQVGAGQGGRAAGGTSQGGSSSGGDSAAGGGGAGGTSAGTGGTSTGTGGTGTGAGGSQQAPVELWEDGATVSSVSTTVDDRFHGVTMDAADNVYAVGYFGAGVEANRTMLVMKYNSQGQPDATFGTAGRVDVDFSPYLGTPVGGAVTTADVSGEEARDVALQSDGKIVVVGRSEDPSVLAPDNTTPIDIVVFRLNADGSRDLTFGDGGALVLNPGAGVNDLAWGVDVDASNRIYVFGHGTATNAPGAATPRTDQDRYCWRLTASGTLDATWGNAGTFTFDIPSGTSTLALGDNQRRGLALAGGGAIMSGYTNVGGRNQVVLAKLLDTGVPDTSFSGDGIVRLAPFPTGIAEAYGVAVQSNGSFVTTGYGNPDAERTGASVLLDMVSFRVTASGAADPTWGVGGAVVYDPGAGEDRGRAILTLADDRILIAGATTTRTANKDALLLLLEKNGAPALDFDAATHKEYDFGGDNEEFFSVALSPSGEFVAAAGYATGAGLANGNAILAIVPVHD